MSATTSLFGRAFVAVCAETIKPRLLAAAMAAAVAVASPGLARADEFLAGDAPAPIRAPEGGSMEETSAGKWVGGAVGAVGAGVVAAALGANKYFTAAASVLGGIGGAKAGEDMASRRRGEVVQAYPGQVVSAEEEIVPRGLEGARGVERSLIFPQRVGRTDLPRMSEETIRSFDGLAITAAAYRLVVQSSYDNYAAAKERLALSPRDVGVSRHFLAVKKTLDADIAGLNIAIADLANATRLLRKSYPGNEFGGYQALQVSISAPAQVRSREVATDRPIYPFAETLAVQIENGEVQHMTQAAPGYATSAAMLRSGGGAQGARGADSAAGPNETMRRLGMR